jgi:chromosome segregation ATPase
MADESNLYEEDFGKPKEKDKLISEIIEHVNSLQEKITALKSDYAELKDVQLVNKLDIINLKNEVDKVRVTSPMLDPETQQTIEDVHGIAHDVKTLKQIKNAEKQLTELTSKTLKNTDDIEVLKNKLNRTQSAATPTTGLHDSEIKTLVNRIQEVEEQVKRIVRAPPAKREVPTTVPSMMRKLERSLIQLTSRIEKLESAKPRPSKAVPASFEKVGKEAPWLPALRKLERSFAMLNARIEKPSSPKTKIPIPNNAGKEITSLTTELSRLTQQVRTNQRLLAALQSTPPRTKPSHGIRSLQKRLVADEKRLKTLEKTIKITPPKGKPPAAPSAMEKISDIITRLDVRVARLESLRPRSRTEALAELKKTVLNLTADISKLPTKIKKNEQAIAQLEKKLTAPSTTRSAAAVKKRTCSKCGNALREGVKFCSKCGKRS